MEHLLDQFKDLIVATMGQWGYVAVFVLMALESACIPIPSEVTMPVGGLLAAEGKLDFFAVGFLGAFANLAGSWVAYAAGRGSGRSLLLKYGKYILIRPHDVEKADLWFEKYGSSAVFFSRLLPVVRTFISLPAGVARMPLVRFSILTFLGCVPWSFALTYAGYLLGENWDKILPYTEPVTYGIAAIVGVAVIYWATRQLQRRHASEPES